MKTATRWPISTAVSAAVGILAYVHKLKTGRGRWSTPLMEAALCDLWHAAIFFATGVSPQALGSSHVLTAPYQAFRTADGYINIGGANQSNWERIADVLGHPEWKADPRFATNADRMRHLAELVAAMEAVLAGHDRAHWIEVFDAAGVPVGPVNSIGEALSHPQVLARGMVVDLQHPQAGATKALGCPVHLSEHRRGSIGHAAGASTRGAARHGYDDAQIDEMAAAGVVEEGRTGD